MPSCDGSNCGACYVTDSQTRVNTSPICEADLNIALRQLREDIVKEFSKSRDENTSLYERLFRVGSALNQSICCSGVYREVSDFSEFFNALVIAELKRQRFVVKEHTEEFTNDFSEFKVNIVFQQLPNNTFVISFGRGWVKVESDLY